MHQRRHRRAFQVGLAHPSYLGYLPCHVG
jgi:hypothetical protein